MSEIFLKILNMSFVASWLILAVILLRLALKKAPKWITCLLWGMVAVRLLCPMSFESSLSLIPNAEPITQEILMTEPPDIHEAPVFDSVVNPNLPDVAPITPDTSIDQVQIKTMLATFVWVIGMGVLLTYATVSYLRLRYKVRASLHLRDNIWLCDEIATPFLLGVFRPKIYIPSGINESSLPPIIAHENAHLKRRDHWWKPLGFLILAIHWFNPLVWLAYILLCRDIELACDEKVIKGWGKEESIAYSEALLSCSVSRRTILVCPLAFGEVGVKERVKRVLNYKKPAFWIVVVAALTSVVLAVCFLTNPKGPREFPMTGRNLSDLDTDQILSGICEAESLDDPSVLNTNADNFDLMVTSDFDLDNAGAIRFYYEEHQKTYCAQLRLFYEENQYFVTERSEWLEQTKIYKLRDYLDALRYLPQEEIKKLSPDADHYSIYMRPEGTPEDYSRVVTYGKDGAGEIGGWQIHLEIVPSQNGHGTGADVIHAFYTSSGFDALADSSPFGRTYHVGKIAFEDSVYNFSYTLETAPLYRLTGEGKLEICENKNDMAWLNAGTFREITLGENFTSCFRDLDGMGWNGVDADTLAEENQQAWQLAVVNQAENTVIYDLLLQKNGDIYLTYGYGSASGSSDIELNSVRWVFYLAEGLSSASASNNHAEVIDASLDAAIQTTLNSICRSSNHSSDPGAYIRNAQEQYDELLGYGEATLRYCFRQFLEGGQTGLEGHIMAQLCRDIMEAQFGMAQVDLLYETGQDWFDAFYANSQEVAENVSLEDMEKYHPVSKVLLDMTGEDQAGEAIFPGNVTHTYKYAGKEPLEGATVILYDDGKFQMEFSPLSSYIGVGQYVTEDNRLILKTEDGEFTYVFDLIEDGLRFDAPSSSTMVWFSGLEEGSILQEGQ